MTPLIIIKINGDHGAEETKLTMASVKEGFRSGALVLDGSCEVIAFDEAGRMVYPIAGGGR